MSCCVEEEKSKSNLGKNYYELIHQHQGHRETIFEYPNQEIFTVSDLQPLLRNFFSSSDSPLEDYLHDFTNNLHILEELQKKHFTIIEGNDNVLDLIKHADLSEYSMMYCHTCKKLQHVTVQGCEGVLLFLCDECDQIVTEVYKVEEQLEIA